jgi:tol-pal system protein YbgF
MNRSISLIASSALALVCVSAPLAALAQSVREAPASAPAAGRLQERVDQLEADLRRATDENERLRRERDQAVAKAAQLERMVDDMQRRPLFEGQTQTGDAQQYAGPPAAVDTVGTQPGSAGAPMSAPSRDYASAGGGVGAPLGPISDGAIVTQGTRAPVEGPPVGPAPVAGVARDVYDAAFALLRARDYSGARRAFTEFTTQYPDHPQTPLAIYWKGRAAAAQADHTDAATQFVELLRRFPETPQAADGAARLGQSLLQLQQTDQACAAFRQAEAHPAATVQVRQLARQESTSARC